MHNLPLGKREAEYPTPNNSYDTAFAHMFQNPSKGCRTNDAQTSSTLIQLCMSYERSTSSNFSRSLTNYDKARRRSAPTDRSADYFGRSPRSHLHLYVFHAGNLVATSTPHPCASRLHQSPRTPRKDPYTSNHTMAFLLR